MGMALKDEYIIKSDRYGYSHKLLSVGNGQYTIQQQEPWMVLGVTYFPYNMQDMLCGQIYGRYDKIEAVDLDGGPYIRRGWTNGEVQVIDIIEINHQIRLIIRDFKEPEQKVSE